MSEEPKRGSTGRTGPETKPVVKPTTAKVNNSVGTQPNEIPIPADYRLLGVTSGYDPRPADGLRMFIVGPAGEGKSTFVSSIPGALILDFEKGANAIPRSKSARVRIKNYDHYRQVVDQLIKDGKQGRLVYSRIIFDTVDEWAALIADRLALDHNTADITEFGSKGHGWALIKNKAWSDVRDLENAGYTWTCVGHLTEKTVTSPIDHKETTVIRALLFGSFAKTIQRNCDVYGTVYNMAGERTVKQTIALPSGIKRNIEKKIPTTVYRLDLSTVGSKEGKLRGVPKMPRMLELPAVDGWGVFKAAYSKAVQEEKVSIEKQGK